MFGLAGRTGRNYGGRMASTLVDLEDRSYRNEGFCAALELAVAAGRELGPIDGAADPGPADRSRREAIRRLRAGATANPGLLALLAEGRFADLPAAATVEDAAVRRALAVPDLFCLAAPPGAAHTLALLEIVRAAAQRGERVLLAAPVAPPVDAIVARLPEGAAVVRAGHDPEGPGGIVTVAAGVQRRVLARSQAAARSLEPWLGEPSPAMGWLRRLTTALTEAAEARERAGRAAAHRELTVREARGRLGADVRARARARDAAERAGATAEGEVERLTSALRRAEGSRLRRWRADRLRRELSEAVRRAGAARAAFLQTRAGYEESARRLDREVEQDGVVRAAADRAAFADVAALRALESAERSAHHLTRLLSGVSEAPPWDADPAGLSALAEHCQAMEPVLRGRAGLLREWRQRAARPTRQLHAELLRYADVVSTSCLDAGRPEYGDLDFDLLVLADAARVPVPDALAALVRARRAVLLGETGRPPLRDPAVVRAWVATRCPSGADPEELTGLLTASVFERIAVRAPEGNRAEAGR
ncbi:hypothetical protein GCM10025331_55380 [Actinoplanes utahensis]